MYASEGASFQLSSPDDNTYQDNVPDDLFEE
jgi:hypothetical protein